MRTGALGRLSAEQAKDPRPCHSHNCTRLPALPQGPTAVLARSMALGFRPRVKSGSVQIKEEKYFFNEIEI